jgi:hypothetical protein
MHIEVHRSGSVAGIVPELERVMRELTPDSPMLQPMTQQAQFDESLSEERLNARLSQSGGRRFDPGKVHQYPQEHEAAREQVRKKAPRPDLSPLAREQLDGSTALSLASL